MLTRVRAKGQITIPDTLRRAAHIEEGDYLNYVVEARMRVVLVYRPTLGVSAE